MVGPAIGVSPVIVAGLNGHIASKENVTDG
jgi:hypothetical protein